jgi:hypothetical protein
MDDQDNINQLVALCLGFFGTGFVFGYLFAMARSIWNRRHKSS